MSNQVDLILQPDDMEAREKLAGQSTSMTKIVTDIPLVLLFSHQVGKNCLPRGLLIVFIN